MNLAFGRCRTRCVVGILVVGVLLGSVGRLQAQDGLEPTVRINLSKQYDLTLWNGEGTPILHRTADGKLVLLQGLTSLGKASHALASDDEGRTWHSWDAYGTWPRMAYSDVVRRGNELLAFGHPNVDCFKGTHVWWSADEGVSWGGGNRLTSDTDRWVPLNQRVLLTSRGRLIVPIDQLLGSEGPDPDQIGVIYSDDGGRSWRRSPIFGPPATLPDRPEGFGEPSVVELFDGRIWMVFRSRFGHLWQAWSSDGGATWGEPTSTGLVSPMSAVNAKRVPQTNTFVLLWNHCQPGQSTDWGEFPNLWKPRSPLTLAISRDSCQTWTAPMIVERATGIYPSIYFSQEEMFVVYMQSSDTTSRSSDYNFTLVVYNIQSILDLNEISRSD